MHWNEDSAGCNNCARWLPSPKRTLPRDESERSIQTISSETSASDLPGEGFAIDGRRSSHTDCRRRPSRNSISNWYRGRPTASGRQGRRRTDRMLQPPRRTVADLTHRNRCTGMRTRNPPFVSSTLGDHFSLRRRWRSHPTHRRRQPGLSVLENWLIELTFKPSSPCGIPC